MDTAIETDLYPSCDFNFHSFPQNQSDFEEPHFLFASTQEKETLENAFSFTNTPQEGDVAEGYMESLLFMDPEFYESPPDFAVSEGDPVVGVVLTVDHEMDREEFSDYLADDLALVEGSPSLSKFQAELIGESGVADLLLIGARAVEAQKWEMASAVLTRLSHLVVVAREVTDQQNPFQRLAFFFTEALKLKSTRCDLPTRAVLPSTASSTTDMSAFQMLQELSPFVKFAHFTANQAILEATRGEDYIHIIDFDVMEGIQWPPLMVDLSLRKDVVLLRVTAVVAPDDNADRRDPISQTGRRLQEFADSINLPFRFDQMVMEEGEKYFNEEYFKEIEMGPSLIANCMIHQLHLPSRSFKSVQSFLNGVAKLSPKMVILVEEELCNFTKIPSMSFVEFFCEALQHYTAFFESLTCSFWGGGYRGGMRVVERDILRVRILESLREFPSGVEEKRVWGEGFSSLRGFKPVPLSGCNVAQAKLLVGLFNGGFRAQHEKCKLALCWKSRPLTTASIWIPK